MGLLDGPSVSCGDIARAASAIQKYRCLRLEKRAGTDAVTMLCRMTVVAKGHSWGVSWRNVWKALISSTSCLHASPSQIDTSPSEGFDSGP